MRPIVKEALKRGGYKPPSSFSGDEANRRKQGILLNWIQKMGATNVGYREVRDHDDSKFLLDRPATFSMEYEPRVMGQRSHVLHVGEPDLDPPVIDQLVERLDSAGLLDWVTPQTCSSDIINLARWSLLGTYEDWDLDGSTGSAIRPLMFGDVLKQDGAPDFFTLSVGWAHGTPWWDLMRHLTSLSIDADLFTLRAHESSDWLREDVDPQEPMPKLIEKLYEKGIGVDLPKHIKNSAHLNAEQKASALQENEENVREILKEDWMQPWWPKAMDELQKKPKVNLLETINRLMPANPLLIVQQHLQELPELIDAVKEYKRRGGGLIDLSELGDMMDESLPDTELNWIHWGRNDVCLENEMIRAWNTISQFDVIIGTEARWIHEGRIMKDTDINLYPIRRNIQMRLCEWQTKLYNYLHPRKSPKGSTSP